MPRPESDRLKLWGLEIPLPKPAVYALAAVAVIAVSVFLYQKVYNDPERVILTLKDVNSRLAFEVEEYGLHVMEEPAKHEMFTDSDGHLSLRVYADHCVLIQRKTSRGVRTKLVLDLSRNEEKARYQRPQSFDWLPVVHASEQGGCNGGCLNPHPGPFEWQYGEQKGDWIQVWRRWREGCTHVQMFHPRTGSWDTNPDGTPRVRWTCCTH